MTRGGCHPGFQHRNNSTELQLRLQLLSCKRIKTRERMELQSSAVLGVHRNNFYNERRRPARYRGICANARGAAAVGHIGTTLRMHSSSRPGRIKIWGGIGRELAPSEERNNFANAHKIRWSATRAQKTVELPNNLNCQAAAAAADARCE